MYNLGAFSGEREDCKQSDHANLNSRFQMSHLISCVSYTNCEVTVRQKCTQIILLLIKNFFFSIQISLKPNVHVLFHFMSSDSLRTKKKKKKSRVLLRTCCKDVHRCKNTPSTTDNWLQDCLTASSAAVSPSPRDAF